MAHVQSMGTELEGYKYQIIIILCIVFPMIQTRHTQTNVILESLMKWTFLKNLNLDDIERI